jgi:hypothetical protein
MLYNDKSVLEMHHAAYSFRLMSQETMDFNSHFTTANFQRFRKVFVESILATDMSHHFEMIATLQALPGSGGLKKDKAEHLTLIANLILHCADLSNPVLPSFTVVKHWADLVCLEFANQVVEEKKRGLPFAAHMEKLETAQQKAKLQVDFIDYVVAPLWNAGNN